LAALLPYFFLSFSLPLPNLCYTFLLWKKHGETRADPRFKIPWYRAAPAAIRHPSETLILMHKKTRHLDGPGLQNDKIF
jgi:hypothetical protein